MTLDRASGGSGGHSADVRMSLTVNGAPYQVAQVGGGRIVLAEDAAVQGKRGELVVSIDGHEQRWMVDLDELDADGTSRRILAAKIVPPGSLIEI